MGDLGDGPGDFSTAGLVGVGHSVRGRSSRTLFRAAAGLFPVVAAALWVSVTTGITPWSVDPEQSTQDTMAVTTVPASGPPDGLVATGPVSTGPLVSSGAAPSTTRTAVPSLPPVPATASPVNRRVVVDAVDYSGAGVQVMVRDASSDHGHLEEQSGSAGVYAFGVPQSGDWEVVVIWTVSSDGPGGSVAQPARVTVADDPVRVRCDAIAGCVVV